MAKRQRAAQPRLNLADLGAALGSPGIDPRTWVSYGTVRGGATDDDPCVEFEEDQPLVRVLLHPSLVEVRCRVAMFHAGDGEAEWHPFVPDDEVIVVIPEGHERAGPVIVGRLANAIDKFPSGSIAGQDPRKNAFAFRRVKAPIVEELNGPILQRSAKTGGFVSIDDAGVLTLRAGNPDDPDAAKPAAGLQMSADGVSIQDASAKYGISFGPTSGALLVLVDDAVLSLSSTAGGHPSMIGVPSTLALTTAGNPALEHAVSTEALVSILDSFLKGIAAGFALIPPSVGGAPGGSPYAAVITALSSSGWANQIASAGTIQFTTLAAINSKISSIGQLQPGICAPGLLIG